MSIETDFYDVISGNAGVQALVGDRIYPMRAPDKVAVPFITYQFIAGEDYDSLACTPTRSRKIVQINCIAPNIVDAADVAGAVKTALYAHVGYLQSEGEEYFDETQNFRVRIDWSLIG